MPPAERIPNDIIRRDMWRWVALALVIIGSVVIRVRLAAIPLERDEGEYAYIAQQMLKGVPPYESAYSMKLPGIYVVYAVVMAMFGQTGTGVHLGLVIFNATTILVIFLGVKRIFGGLAAIASACAYAITSLGTSILGLSANVEHFVVLPAIAGLLLIYNAGIKRRYVCLFSAGLLLGIAFVIKQHGIFFTIFGSLYLLYCDLRRKPLLWRNAVFDQVVFSSGAILPFALVCMFYWRNGTFDEFWFWTFTYAREYATRGTLSQAWGGFIWRMHIIVKELPLIWFFALSGIAAVIGIRSFRPGVLFILGLLLFSFLAVCPGFYFRGHYFILVLPAVTILAGAGFALLTELIFLLKKIRIPGVAVITGLMGLAVAGFSVYQQRAFLFDNPPERVCRMIYGGNPFPESLEIAEYIKKNSSPDATIAIIGSEPQIYFYANRRAVTRYIYTYPLMELHGYAEEMQKEMIAEIESARPEFIIFVNVSTSWLVRANSVKLIFEWYQSYCTQFYEVVGVADIIPDSSVTIYRWGQQAAEYTPRSSLWVSVHKRKQ